MAVYSLANSCTYCCTEVVAFRFSRSLYFGLGTLLALYGSLLSAPQQRLYEVLEKLSSALSIDVQSESKAAAVFVY